MTTETIQVAGLILNFAIGGFVVLTNYRVTKIEKDFKLVRRFLARHTNFNIDNLSDEDRKEMEA
jgi:hypothetical protein